MDYRYSSKGKKHLRLSAKRKKRKRVKIPKSLKIMKISKIPKLPGFSEFPKVSDILKRLRFQKL